MDHLKKFQKRTKQRIFLYVVMTNFSCVSLFVILNRIFGLSGIVSLSLSLFAAVALAYLLALVLNKYALEPLKAVWQAVLHVSPGAENIRPPKLDELTVGRELAASLIAAVYDLTNSGMALASAQMRAAEARQNEIGNLLEYVPLPVFVLDKNQQIIKVNKIGASYIEKMPQEVIGTNINDSLHMSFNSGDTFENWLRESVQTRLTAEASWDRVRLNLGEDKSIKQFDLIARYSKDDPHSYETLLAIFDHTDRYNTEDSSTSYVSLAVHELRTPLTVLRGYIEALEDELAGKLTPELEDFMRKMSASAQTLTAFVSNILNVARVDENQLTLSLHEANWNELLPEICKDLELRVKVRGKLLELDLLPNLPTVGVDRISIYEVLSNLVDNAIKYSGESSRIVIHTGLGKDGTIETTVQDFGIGIPENAMKHLFSKFYRSHRSKASVGGSGLGLYLVKAIVTAHGGNVWVQSKEGEGSTFGFSLKPYSQVANEDQGHAAGSIERQAHGWIKNHSMYRR